MYRGAHGKTLIRNKDRLQTKNSEKKHHEHTKCGNNYRVILKKNKAMKSHKQQSSSARKNKNVTIQMVWFKEEEYCRRLTVFLHIPHIQETKC